PEHPRRRDEHDADRTESPILELDSRAEDSDADEGQGELGPGEPAHGPATPPALGIGGSSSAPASSSGTSSTIRSNAVENTLPCAAVLSDIVPPPSRAPCKRKLSACRFGSSNRSTGPVITSLKCSAMRSFVS